MKNLLLVVSFIALTSGCTSEASKNATANKTGNSSVASEIGAAQSPCDALSIQSVEPKQAVQVEKKAGSVTLTSTASEGFAGGKTAGASIKLSDACEQFVSGKAIRIAFSARSAAATDVKTAFSTNEVGNSGWKTFPLSPQFERYEFEYDVPALQAGGGDYIGFLPVSGSIDVKDITITSK